MYSPARFFGDMLCATFLPTASITFFDGTAGTDLYSLDRLFLGLCFDLCFVGYGTARDNSGDGGGAGDDGSCLEPLEGKYESSIEIGPVIR